MNDEAADRTLRAVEKLLQSGPRPYRSAATIHRTTALSLNLNKGIK